MAKSSRRKKQDRARAEARRAEQARRRVRAERNRQEIEHYQQLLDPQTPPDEVARLISAEMPESLAPGAIARIRLSAGVPVGELSEASRLLLADASSAPGPLGLGVLAFAAAAAHAAGDEDGEHRYAAELLARAEAENEVLRQEVIRSIAANGHPDEAIELMAPYLRDNPGDEHAAEIYATALERAYEGAERGEPGQAALDQFADRSGLVALREAIGGYLERTKWGSIVRRRVEEVLAETTDEDWSADEHEAFAALAYEFAVEGAADREDDDDEDIDELIERDRREGLPETALTAFAADPSVPEVLASRASAWAEHAHCGVWQLADPVAKPGVWCTELVTGTVRYVEFPASALDGTPRWTVWLGSVGPVDGIWRSTGNGVRLSPAEGDAVAEYLEQAVESVAHRILGLPSHERPEPEPIRFGHAEPYGVRWEFDERMPETYARLSSTVTATLITQLAVEVARHRETPPQLRNTDDEPMLFIKATITVDGNVTERLMAHPDFECEDDDRTQIVWWGNEIPAARRDAMLAELRARGQLPVVESDDFPRWVRGQLTSGDGELHASVNSRERLNRLVRILAKLGAHPVVTAEERVDPAMDFAWGSAPLAAVAGAAPAAEGWENSWLDEEVPALHGRTPRQAATGDAADVVRLESLLRQFEYQAGLATLQGEKGIDVPWLREELDMPSLRR